LELAIVGAGDCWSWRSLELAIAGAGGDRLELAIVGMFKLAMLELLTVVAVGVRAIIVGDDWNFGDVRAFVALSFSSSLNGDVNAGDVGAFAVVARPFV
jgi:hypothetical protein